MATCSVTAATLHGPIIHCHELDQDAAQSLAHGQHIPVPIVDFADTLPPGILQCKHFNDLLMARAKQLKLDVTWDYPMVYNRWYRSVHKQWDLCDVCDRLEERENETGFYLPSAAL